MKVSWKAVCIVVGLVCCAPTMATAAVIYQDSFTRTGALNGTSPDVVNVPAATWTANGTITTNGSIAINPGSTAAFLPFTPATGVVYTLSADLNAVSGDWGAFGFSGTSNTAGLWHVANPTASAWMLERADRVSGDAFFAGPATNNSQGIGNSVAGFNTFSIVLDTTNPLAWTTSIFRGNTQVGTTFTYTTNPTIAFVGFGNSGASQINNFTLSVVPEPGSFAIMGLGMVMIGLVRRRFK